MNRNLLISFVLLVISFLIMRFQGEQLVTPASPRGIIDLEFARTAARYFHLRLFMSERAVTQNLLLDFLFIAAYTYFLITASRYIGAKAGWKKWSGYSISLVVSAACFDIAENFILFLILKGRFDTALLELVFWCALVKFVLAGIATVFVLFGLPLALARKVRRHPKA